jgi:hypothetical protein
MFTPIEAAIRGTRVFECIAAATSTLSPDLLLITYETREPFYLLKASFSRAFMKFHHANEE